MNSTVFFNYKTLWIISHFVFQIENKLIFIVPPPAFDYFQRPIEAEAMREVAKEIYNKQ